MLRPSQTFRLSGGIVGSLGPGFPRQLATRGFEQRALAAWRDCQQSAFTFDHHAPRFAQRSGHQGDARIRILGDTANPFCTGAGFAKPATGQNQPGVPPTFGGDLAFMRPYLPVRSQRLALTFAHSRQHLAPRSRRHRQQLFAPGAIRISPFHRWILRGSRHWRQTVHAFHRACDRSNRARPARRHPRG